MTTELTRGIRCLKCGNERTHVVTEDAVADATSSAEERAYGTEHRRWCGGTLVRWTSERVSPTRTEINVSSDFAAPAFA